VDLEKKPRLVLEVKLKEESAARLFRIKTSKERGKMNKKDRNAALAKEI